MLLALLVTGVVTDTVNTKRIMVPRTKVDHVEAVQIFEAKDVSNIPSFMEPPPPVFTAAVATIAAEGKMDAFLVIGAVTDTVDTMPKRSMVPRTMRTKVDHVEAKDVLRVLVHT